MFKISCFVDKEGHVYQGANGLEYKFDLATRRMVTGGGEPARGATLGHAMVARDFFDRLAGTPEKLIEFARQGTLEKLTLVDLLAPPKR